MSRKGRGAAPGFQLVCRNCWDRFALLSRHKAAPTKAICVLPYQRPAASWSLCLPSTQRGPSWVFSFFQNGARVFR
ncbi:MAG TPA: hypothetical protein DGQ94_19255 [Pseudomonas sp.]|nr:hypothetical protein DZC31_23190 [Stenotrophomonas rhizophila]PIK75583.1 hypothetical protein CQW31_26390 [Pseudomonas sp. 382]HCV40810.1 hypothetical protein [Pseudomonas sp.]